MSNGMAAPGPGQPNSSGDIQGTSHPVNSGLYQQGNSIGGLLFVAILVPFS
jgi:hypothetical protein